MSPSKRLERIYVTPEFKQTFQLKKIESGYTSDIEFSDHMAQILRGIDAATVKKIDQRQKLGFRPFK